MGSSSGRHGGHVTIEGCGSYRLSAKDLREALRHPPGTDLILRYRLQEEPMVVHLQVRPAHSRAVLCASNGLTSGNIAGSQMFMFCSHRRKRARPARAGTEGVTDDPLLPLLDELARRHGDGAKVTVVVRAGRLVGGAAVYTDDDLREAVAAIGRKAGMEFGVGDRERERERRRGELLRQAVELLAAVERFRRGWEREPPACGATLALLREQLRET